MKLFLCEKCNEVRSLRIRKLVSCECGYVCAMYVDNGRCEWNGNGFLLGFSNPTLIMALRSQLQEGDHPDGMGRDFTAFVIPTTSKNVKINPKLGVE